MNRDNERELDKQIFTSILISFVILFIAQLFFQLLSTDENEETDPKEVGTEAEENIRRCQVELRDLCEEIRMQNCTIEALNCKLHERIAQVDEREKAIENFNKDIDKRMKGLDEQLKKYECELINKAKQNESLLIYQGELEENNACLLRKLSAGQRQLSQIEKCCQQEIDSLNRELEDPNSKLADRENQLAQCKDCLNLKDDEIMRLKLRLCSTDQCGDNCSNDQYFSNSNVPDLTLSDVEWQDTIEGLLLLNVSNSVCSIASRSTDDSNKQWTLNENKDSISNFATGSISKEDIVFEPVCQISNDSSIASNSIGAAEVQERLRPNQIQQIEIEGQLKCLEEETVEDTPQPGVESEPVLS